MTGFAAGIADPHLHQHGLAGHVRIDLRLLDPDRAGRQQFKASDHAVPVPLRVIGDAVRPGSNVHDHAVVHPDCQRVLARLEPRAEVIAVRRRETRVSADLPAVQPDACFPMGALQPQHHALAVPGRRNVHHPLIPGCPDIMLLRLQEERHLDVARPTVFRVLRAFEPGIDAYLPGPLRIHRDVVAETLVLQGAGQLEALLQGALEPAFRYSRIPAIQLKPPLAGQRDAGSLGRHGPGTKPAD